MRRNTQGEPLRCVLHQPEPAASSRGIVRRPESDFLVHPFGT